MSFYTDCNVNINGGSSNIISGDQILNGLEKISGFERLENETVAGALHNSGEISGQAQCHPGTRDVILKHLIEWAESLIYTSPITWLHGPAGAGKSAILRTIAQILFERGLLVASFFFFRTSAGRNSSDKFIATIVYQVACSIPATRPLIEKAIEKNPVIFSLSLWDQARDLIVSPILATFNDPSFKSPQFPRIIIVDGLDECRDSDKQRDILQVLCRVVKELPLPFAVLVASRPEHHIRDAFDGLNISSFPLFLDKSDADIEAYLTDRFRAIQAKHPLRSSLPASPWPSQSIIDKLVANASGQFIYAATVDKFISSPRHNPAKRLDVILGIRDAGPLKPFEQLDLLYSTIFQTIDPVDLADTLRILGILLVPQNVMENSSSPAFLESLLELETGDIRHSLFDLESLLTISRDDENIRFFHASLSDYLFDRSRSGQFVIDAGMIYAYLAQQCLLQLYKPIAVSRGFRAYFAANSKTFFSKATPTLPLHRAIKNCDLTKVGRHGLLGELSPILLEAIRVTTFSDADALHRAHLRKYTRMSGKRILAFRPVLPNVLERIMDHLHFHT